MPSGAIRRSYRAVAVPFAALLALAWIAGGARAAELRVPEDYTSIQAALDVAAPGDTVSVAPGVYAENVSFKSNGVTLRSRTRHAATIQGDGTSHVVTFNPYSGTVDGFVITGSGPSRSGVFTSQAQQVIAHNVITGNDSGIAISSNSIAWIEANRIEGNASDFFGKGIRIASGASGTVINNVIAGSGVGIEVSNFSSAEIINNSLIGNALYGMLFGLSEGVSTLRNNVITGSGVGIHADGPSVPDPMAYIAQYLEIDYNLLWNNQADYWASLLTYTPDGLGQESGYIGPFDPLPGTSEVHADPLLDPVTGYELTAGSAAIDAGDNAVCPATDLDGHVRPYDGDDPPDGFADCDIGAVEYVPEPGRALLLLAGALSLGLISRLRSAA